MKRWIVFAASLYPRRWREEYGREFDAVLEELRPGWRLLANVLAGGIGMHMKMTKAGLTFAAAVVAGTLAGWGASFAVAPHYISSAVIGVTPRIDPLRPLSPGALHQRAAARAAELESEVLSRTRLSPIVLKLDLYRRDWARLPFEIILERMRRNIRIQQLAATSGSLSPILFSIAFDYPDPAGAHAATREIAARFTDANALETRDADLEYLSFWGDEALEARALHRSQVTAPPPPMREIVAVVIPPNVAKRVRPNRNAFLAFGFGAGVLLGLLAILVIGQPRGTRRLVGFAAAAGMLAYALSFAIPDRYTSTAVMMTNPAVLMKNPLATPPAATQAAELLRQLEPKALSIQELSKVIQDPRLDLYPADRERKPIEDVARTMLTRDLRVEPVNLAPDGAAVNTLRISFSYRDRLKAQQVVQTMISLFEEVRETGLRDRADHDMDPMEDQILQRRANEQLVVLDPPSLPYSPDHDRLSVAAAGTGIGLLLGALTLVLRRRPLAFKPEAAATAGDPNNQQSQTQDRIWFAGLAQT